MEKFTTLRPEAQAKVDKLFKDMNFSMMKLTFEGLVIAVLSAFPIAAISILAGVEKTAFPMVAGFLTWILINVRYLRPGAKDIGEYYGEKIKEVVEDERRAQAEESGLARPDSREGS